MFISSLRYLRAFAAAAATAFYLTTSIIERLIFHACHARRAVNSEPSVIRAALRALSCARASRLRDVIDTIDD